jgi:WD40 repeat protein
MFRCLSERGPDQRDTRRPVRVKEVAEVCGVPPDRIIDIVEVFRRQGRSFITPPAEKPLDSDKILDISHESLIRQWKRMSKWVGKEAGSADMYRNLERTALRWESGHAAPWGTPDLDLALKWKESENPTSAWAKRYGTDYELAMKFLDASEQKREADEQEEIERRKRELEQAQALAVERERAEEKTRSARNTKIYLGIMAGLLCLMIVSAFLALDKSRTTRIALQEVDEARKRAEDSQLKAEEARDEADRLLQVSKSQTLAFRAPRQQRLGRQDERAALLAREAYILNSRFGGQTLSQFDEALRTILSADHFSHILHAHQARVNSVALSKNGTTLASAGDDKTILLWNLNNPTIEPIELKGNHRKNNSVVFSPDGATLASISDANKLLLWDYENPAATPKVLDSYQGKINSMAFSPLGSRLASAGSDGTVWLWDLNNSTNKPEAFKAHEGPVLSAAFSPDGATLASTGKDQAVRLWNLKNPDSKPIQLKNPKLKETKDPEPLIFNSVIFSPIGKTVAATSGSTLYLWERKYPVKRPRFLKGHSDTIHSIAFRPDGNMIATASQDNTVRLWDPERGVADPHAALGDLDMAEAVLEGFEGRVNSVVFSSDGNTLAAASDDNSLRIWDLRKPVAKPSSLEGSQKNILSVCFSPDGHTLASAGADKIVRLWDLKNPSAKSKELRGHDFQVNSVAFSPDGTILASASDDGSVRLWDLTNSANQLESFRNHKGSVWSVAFSPDGKILASAGEDGVVCLRYLDKTAREPIHLKEHRGAVYSVTFSPDAATLASAGADRTVRLWDLNNSERKHKFFWDHEGQVYSVAFSPDGATLAASGDDQNIYLWDLKNLTKKPIVPPLSAHKGSIYSVIFSPTGDIVASAGADRVVRLWNLKNLDAEPVVLKSHKGWIESVAFSPDGRTLASAGDDKTILLHLAPTSALADIVCEKVWRNLNMREWVKFVGAKEDYEKTCPDLPAP